MSIRRDLVIKVSNGTATLDMPLQIYEKDHGIELRFKLMDYKYKYDKDPENILNSNKEDILEAYTTIVNPSGYELAQINGEVVDDTIKFMIEDSYTDELEELGTYQLQIHVKCTHSEFSIPPVRFEVLERLKGEKVVTDGDDEVDYSDIIDGSTKFVDDETGKLIIQWQKGDTISSVRLNAMVEVINNAVDEEAQRQLNEVEREQQELEREQQELERENRLQAALDSVDARVDASMDEYETRFNALTASQQQDMEVIDARDGETSLKARLDRDIEKPLQVYEDVESSYISCDSTDGYAQNVEILGNTIQDAYNLADIRSVGDDVEGQELYEIDVLITGKNLFDRNDVESGYLKNDGSILSSETWKTSNFIKVNGGLTYYFSNLSSSGASYLVEYDKDKKIINSYTNTNVSSNKKITLHSDTRYIRIATTDLDRLQIEQSDVATPYESYKEDKLTILSPVQLEKVGDVADRIICKDGVWGVEKNVVDFKIDNVDDWEINYSIDDYISFITKEPKFLSKSVCYSNKFAYSIDGDSLVEFITVVLSGKIAISILKNKLDTATLKGFINWGVKENAFIKTSAKNPEFIPLPHDQQIKLRTFAGQTNIHFETEIEGTIKASIPQSIGSTISTHTEQIDNLNKELDRVKKLEESTVSTVVTESDFTTVTETTNGYLEDVKLEGRTLVNLINYSKTLEATVWNYFVTTSDLNCMLKPNTEYTIIAYVQGLSNGKAFFIQSNNSHGIFITSSIEVTSNGTWALKVTTKADLTDITNVVFIAHNPNNNVGTYTISLCILEGDHTQNPPSYFEGLMSVGQDVDEISVESCNENLVEYMEVCGISWSDGRDYASPSYARTNYIKAEPQQTYYIKRATFISYDEICSVYMYAYNMSYLGYENIYSNSVKTKPGTRFVRFETHKADGTAHTPEEIANCDFMVSVDEIVNYIPHQSNKKQILYYNPETQTWEKPILRQWDSIEKHADGKYYYHKRSSEVVFNGSEEWSKDIDFNSENASRFKMTLKDGKYKDSLVACNNIPIDINDNWRGAYFRIDIDYLNALGINIENNKLSTRDLAGFKAWLQANPTTVVYQLTQEKVYECINIDLITYADETNLIVNSGALSPKTTLKVHSNVANVVTLLQKKALQLEESTITNDRKIVTHTEQIGNLSKELDKVKKLEESTVSTVVTENDFTTVTETTNGYFEDVKLEGKTLVNLFSLVGTSHGTWSYIKFDNSMLQLNNIYTAILVGLPTGFKWCVTESTGTHNYCEYTTANMSTFIPHVISSTHAVIHVNNGGNSTLTQDDLLKMQIIILEGDHTQNPPEYFEGLMSVGEDVDEMSVESVDGDGNLIDETKITLNKMVNIYGNLVAAEKSRLSDYIKVKNGDVFTVPSGLASGTIGVALYNKNKNYIKSIPLNTPVNTPCTFTVDNDGYMRVALWITQPMMLFKGDKLKEYQPYQSDKKPLLYYNKETDTWEKPILRQWDSIEKHADGKYYYHKRSGEVVLNGSENWHTSYWGAGNDTKDNIMMFECTYDCEAKVNDGLCILVNDKLPSYSWTYIAENDAEGLGISGNDRIRLCISKSKLTSLDMTGFRTWLQANPTTVVYQLAAEEVYECINIDLITYENETNFIVNTGAITPLSTLKVMCNINNVVRELQQKVSNLENYIQHVMIDALNNALNE